MKRAVWNAAGRWRASLLRALHRLRFPVRIEQQSSRDEARPADLILVLGAAEYRGRPSPVLRARLDHALDLYRRKLAPRIMTTGGAGGDPVYTEGGVGRSYLIGARRALGEPSSWRPKARAPCIPSPPPPKSCAAWACTPSSW